jgi:CPA2 family monovalent cation:H+ antiporter-2
VPEAFESGLMLASHALVVAGVPLSRVMRRVSQVRDQQYGLLRGLFHGREGELDGDGGARLHAVTLEPGADGIGKTLEALHLEALGVQLRAVRRRGVKGRLAATQAGPLQEGDVVVMLGSAEALSAAEFRLVRG